IEQQRFLSIARAARDPDRPCNPDLFTQRVARRADLRRHVEVELDVAGNEGSCGVRADGDVALRVGRALRRDGDVTGEYVAQQARESLVARRRARRQSRTRNGEWNGAPAALGIQG